MALHGRAFTEDEIQRVASLLADTDMTIAEIATRMGCSRSTILTINRKQQVRTYDGLRSTWRKLDADPVGGPR
jgi:DNA invertase Pin-like site-specific DNA recombinase